MTIAIIGAGAAGCFCSIHLKQMIPSARVEVFEAGQRPLAKVAVTGGGRCNLTNTFAEVRSLKEVYPRGEQIIKRAFHLFDPAATRQWFEDAGVRLVAQSDQCIFPASQDAMQIVHTLLYNMQRLGVEVHTSHRITDIAGLMDAYDAVVVTTGGSPKRTGLSFLDRLHLDIAEPIPSLFSFNIDGTSELMGTVVSEVTTLIAGTRFRAHGPLLFTHWGMSGPAIIKLSSLAARHLHECSYKAQLLVNWMNDADEEEVRDLLQQYASQSGSRQVQNLHPASFTSRLWGFLIARAGIRPEQRWAEVGRKQLNRLIAVLTADTYSIIGQSRHKEEFVTCGGVALSNINPSTLACKQYPNLFFAGEVLDVDGVTGGFNLQAAWSMGYVVAHSICELNKSNNTICESTIKQK